MLEPDDEEFQHYLSYLLSRNIPSVQPRSSALLFQCSG
jgi:hypothetical protein